MINIANTNTYKIKEIIEDLKQQLTSIYGDRLSKLVHRLEEMQNLIQI